MKRLSALLIATAALMACNQAEQTTQAPDNRNDIQPVKSVGNTLKEFRITDETSVRFQETDGAVTLSLEGHVDEQEINRDLENRLFKAPTMEAAYRVMDPSGQVPQAILDYDKRPVTNAEASVPKASDLAGPGSTLAPANDVPLAKASNHANPAADAYWDWTADATWWKGVVGYKCGWHESLTYTNITWADDWRQGWYASGYLLAASHTYGATATAYIWKNGAWSLTNSMTLQPRHYIVWYSGDKSKQYRRYRIAGDGGALARVDWGMRWDSQAPSDLGVICQS